MCSQRATYKVCRDKKEMHTCVSCLSQQKNVQHRFGIKSAHFFIRDSITFINYFLLAISASCFMACSCSSCSRKRWARSFFCLRCFVFLFSYVRLPFSICAGFFSSQLTLTFSIRHFFRVALHFSCNIDVWNNIEIQLQVLRCCATASHCHEALSHQKFKTFPYENRDRLLEAKILTAYCIYV